MAVINAFTQDALDQAETSYRRCRLCTVPRRGAGRVCDRRDRPGDRVLVDLDHVADPVPWERVDAIAAASVGSHRAPR